MRGVTIIYAATLSSFITVSIEENLSQHICADQCGQKKSAFSGAKKWRE